MSKYQTVVIASSLAAVLQLLAATPGARADIFKWEYINPADPSQGKQQSTTVCPGGAGLPGGAGVNAMPGANLLYRNLTMAYLVGAELTGADARAANLSNAELSQANLTNAYFATIPNYDWAANLTGANLSQSNLTDADFSGFEGTGQEGEVYFYIGADLTGANLSGANLTNTELFTANLTNANLSQTNLTNLALSGVTLTGANLSGADVAGASFSRRAVPNPYHTEFGGVTAAQLYSTASYQAHDLTGIGLGGNDLTGVNFAGQRLTNASFAYATLTDANLTGADARGANFQYATLDGANTSNLIQSNGHIAGLGLTAGASLVVRDYDGGVPIVVDQHMAMDATSTLRLVFDADRWDSTISFAPAIPVTKGGTLELAFAPGVDPGGQLGRTIDLFNWAGVMPTGEFSVSSPYAWNLSNLYTTGEVTLTAAGGFVLGDINGDCDVDADDLASWKAGFGTTGNATLAQGDADGDHNVNGRDFLIWQRQLGSGPSTIASSTSVPEPASLAMLAFSLPLLLRRRATQRS